MKFPTIKQNVMKIFSAFGVGLYQVGSPVIRSATLHLENGNTFLVEAKNQDDKNVFIQKIELNGKILNRLYLTHDEIIKGGKIVFYMSSMYKG